MPEMAAVCNGKQGENAVFHLCFPQQPAERFASVVVHAEKPSPALCVRGTACCSALRFGLFLLALNTSGRYLQRISRTDPKATFSDADSATFLKPRSDSFFHCLRTPLSLHKSKGEKGKNISRFFAFCSRVYEKELHSSVICPLSLLCPARRCGILRMCRKIRMYRPRQTRKVRFCFLKVNVKCVRNCRTRRILHIRRNRRNQPRFSSGNCAFRNAV